MLNTAAAVYEFIDRESESNMSMQGLSGILGFPFTVIGDIAVLFTHYGPMLNHIRGMYGREPVSSGYISPLINGCKKELLADLIADKVIGNIPVIGIASNIMCAKAMTWRLGILFAMLAVKSEEIHQDTVELAVHLIREKFPPLESTSFLKPSMEVVEELLKYFDDKESII